MRAKLVDIRPSRYAYETGTLNYRDGAKVKRILKEEGRLAAIRWVRHAWHRIGNAATARDPGSEYVRAKLFVEMYAGTVRPNQKET